MATMILIEQMHKRPDDSGKSNVVVLWHSNDDAAGGKPSSMPCVIALICPVEPSDPSQDIVDVTTATASVNLAFHYRQQFIRQTAVRPCHTIATPPLTPHNIATFTCVDPQYHAIVPAVVSRDRLCKHAPFLPLFCPPSLVLTRHVVHPSSADEILCRLVKCGLGCTVTAG